MALRCLMGSENARHATHSGVHGGCVGVSSAPSPLHLSSGSLVSADSADSIQVAADAAMHQLQSTWTRVTSRYQELDENLSRLASIASPLQSF
mmetsp:Transcript_46078/g.116606  ORF Transcript_46078/g.116606 Transcript_46078/m.116606 type:complete len:93 (+) Transcript_46078:3597-3875(+)